MSGVVVAVVIILLCFTRELKSKTAVLLKVTRFLFSTLTTFLSTVCDEKSITVYKRNLILDADSFTYGS